MRPWREFYQVWVTFKNGHRKCVFKTGDPMEATIFAENKVAHQAMKRAEVRDKWGDEPIRFVWVIA